MPRYLKTHVLACVHSMRGKKKHHIFWHKHIFFRSSLTGNHLRLTPAVSWSLSLIFLNLNHTLSMLLPDNFFHCSQTPNRRELRGFRDNFRHSLQRRRLKDALEDVGVLPKCTFAWTHTGALSSRCYSCVTDTKMMFLAETPDTDASSRTV